MYKAEKYVAGLFVLFFDVALYAVEKVIVAAFVGAARYVLRFENYYYVVVFV